MQDQSLISLQLFHRRKFQFKLFMIFEKYVAFMHFHLQSGIIKFAVPVVRYPEKPYSAGKNAVKYQVTGSFILKVYSIYSTYVIL